jgi:D-sedoheptulose 7-phosphate isomerase
MVAGGDRFADDRGLTIRSSARMTSPSTDAACTPMSFPERAYEQADDYLGAYRQTLLEAWQSVDPHAVDRAAAMLDTAIAGDHAVFACGNGGSAAIANHLCCDWLKGIQTDTALRPRVISLAATIELITAIANDIAYEEIFVYQLRSLARPGDVLITISASGNSENIVRALRWARGNGVGSVALTGFDGGRSASLADANLHVRAANYGVVEDVHQSLMHILAQYLRQHAMSPELVAQRRF